MNCHFFKNNHFFMNDKFYLNQKKIIEELPPSCQSYFLMLPGSNLSQELIKQELLNFQEECTKTYLRIENQSEPKKSPKKFKLDQNQGPVLKYINQKKESIREKISKLEKQNKEEKLALLKNLFFAANQILENQKFFVIPLTLYISKIENQTIGKLPKLRNKLLLLKYYGNAVALINRLPNMGLSGVNSIILNRMISDIYNEREQQSQWFPRSEQSERLQNFILSKYIFKADANHQVFLNDIMSMSNDFLQTYEIKPLFFPVVYLLVYRAAFDSIYPFYFKTIQNTTICFPHSPNIEFSEESKKESVKGFNILNLIQYETNPIDIAYNLTSLGPIFTNMINIDRKSKGLQPSASISADQCIDSMQFLLYENHFIIAVEAVGMIDKFSTSEDFPASFTFMCECFKAAILGLLENPKQRRPVQQ